MFWVIQNTNFFLSWVFALSCLYCFLCCFLKPMYWKLCFKWFKHLITSILNQNVTWGHSMCLVSTMSRSVHKRSLLIFFYNWLWSNGSMLLDVLHDQTWELKQFRPFKISYLYVCHNFLVICYVLIGQNTLYLVS